MQGIVFSLRDKKKKIELAKIECGENPGILRGIMSVPQNIVMDMNSVMSTLFKAQSVGYFGKGLTMRKYVFFIGIRKGNLHICTNMCRGCLLGYLNHTKLFRK